jgi:integral membrane protein
VLSTPIGRLRLVGLIEGVSFLLLLCVAMPIKYVGGHPEPVFYVGLAHGILFILFLVAILHASSLRQITKGRAAFAFAASVLPAGTFVLDPYLRRDQDALAASPERAAS